MNRLLSQAAPETREIVVTGPAGGTVRSDYLRWFLLRAIPSAGAAISRFELHNTTITDSLDLRGATVGLLLRFVNCVVAKTLQLSDAKVIGIDFVGGKIEAIAGDRVTVDGSLRLLAPKFVSQTAQSVSADQKRIGTRIKQIRLCGATIHGNLDLRGSVLGGEVQGKRVTRPLFADGISVDGNVLLSKGFRSDGEICLNGSSINRNLDCSGATLVNQFGYAISVAGAKISGAALLCRQYWRDKDDDDEDLQRIFQSRGLVRLDGAKISGDLNCQNATFTATAFDIAEWHPDDPRNSEPKYDSTAEATHAIKANGVEVGGDVSFGSTSTANRFDIQGMVSLIGAQIGGDLYISNARLNFPGELVVCADVMTVDGTVFIDKSYSNGILSFVQATLKQGLTVENVTFDVRQGSRHWLDEMSDTDEDLEGPACGVYAAFAEVSGTFEWQKINKIALDDGSGKIRLWLNLFRSRGSTVQDDEKSWKTLDRFDVAGAEYDSIADLNGADVNWRLAELDRQYALFNERYFWIGRDLILALRTMGKHAWDWLCHIPRHEKEKEIEEERVKKKEAKKLPVIPTNFTTAHERESFYVEYDRLRFKRDDEDNTKRDSAVRRFKPQPYLQLAKTYRAAGYQAAARKVIVRLERNETRYSDIGGFAILWRWLLDLTIQYGHALFRPIIILAVWVALSATVFELAYDYGKIVQFKESKNSASIPGQSGTATASKKNMPVPQFNSLVFAIDTLVPIVDLNQKKNWTVNPISASGVHDPAGSAGLSEAIDLVKRQWPDWGAALLLIFNTFFGWLMTTLFVAGVSGLIRPKES